MIEEEKLYAFLDDLEKIVNEHKITIKGEILPLAFKVQEINDGVTVSFRDYGDGYIHEYRKQLFIKE